MVHAEYWIAAVGASALLAIWGRHPARMPIHWVFKPLPALLLIFAVHTLAPPGGLRHGVCLALGFSLVGDIFLMLPPRFFIGGVSSFLAALICYGIAYSLHVPFQSSHLLWLFVPWVVTVPVSRALWPHLLRHRTAILIYAATMSLLLWRLLVRAGAPDVSWTSWALACAGGTCFFVSDILVAFRRFAGQSGPYAIGLGAYYVAQLLLAQASWS